MIHCHCRDCQYASGGDGSTAMIVNADAVSVQGTATSYAVTADSGTTVVRQFCGTCGSPLFASSPVAPAVMVIKIATLDDPSWIVRSAHIWTDSAHPWALVPEAILKFPKNFGAS